jgi:hypothetical protein
VSRRASTKQDEVGWGGTKRDGVGRIRTVGFRRGASDLDKYQDSKRVACEAGRKANPPEPPKVYRKKVLEFPSNAHDTHDRIAQGGAGTFRIAPSPPYLATLSPPTPHVGIHPGHRKSFARARAAGNLGGRSISGRECIPPSPQSPGRLDLGDDAGFPGDPPGTVRNSVNRFLRLTHGRAWGRARTLDRGGGRPCWAFE